MKIGIDLSPLQGPHRMRGIGFTLINFINSLGTKEKKEHQFTFYVSGSENMLFKDPVELLNLEGMTYRFVTIKHHKKLQLTLPSRLNLLVALINNLISLAGYYYGQGGFKNVRELDVFMQFDQSQPLPHSPKVKKVLILYDMIPYLLEWDYLWSYKTARLNNRSRKGALKKQLQRWLYYKKLSLNARSADLLIAISKTTKRDVLKYINVSPDKIRVTHLGVPKKKGYNTFAPSLESYQESSWGYVKRPLDLKGLGKFLFFVGGVDHRRKLQDVVTAFNHLRARDHELKLVLAGDIMLGPGAITIVETQIALKKSSYLDDIIFMGFIDDNKRNWLYKNALAFVFPSRYEGFGLPVLEALSEGCPVISYRNDATVEVAGDAPLYASNALELVKCVENLLERSQDNLKKLRREGVNQAAHFNWEKTTREIFTHLQQAANT